MSKKSLIIVESPAKGHKIQELLGDQYIVMASKGHIADLACGGKWGLGIDIKNNFKPRYVLNSDKIQLIDELLSISKQCNNILLMADADREGCAIAWHLKQRLQDTGLPIKRATFNKITKPILIKAIKEAGEIDMNLFHSQEARRILDRIVGFSASPFLMNVFENTLSAGRVQSVVVRMIADRDNEIKNFNPETFFTINVSLSKDGKNGFQTKFPGKLTEKKSADAMYLRLSAKDKYIVSKVAVAEELKYPLPPLITSSLQRIMSKNYDLSPDQTMKAAQSLYENGFCSYIRTDSVRVSNEALNELRSWIGNKYKVPEKAYQYKNKDSSQDAHECIYPTDLDLIPNENKFIIDTNEKLVYENIWKYYIASQMMPAVFNTVKIIAHVDGDPKAEVRASGKALKTQGYLEILGITDNSVIEIPDLNKGDMLSLFGKEPVKLEEKQTQPPPRYSNDKLIKELEIKNIGRPSTFASLLETITHRNYVEKKGSTYHATDLGHEITNILLKYFNFMDYNFSAQLEQKLDDIASGKINHIEMLNGFYPSFKEEIDKAYQSNGKSLCEKCQSPMRKIKGKNGDFLGCSSYPKCVQTKNIENLSIAV